MSDPIKPVRDAISDATHNANSVWLNSSPIARRTLVFIAGVLIGLAVGHLFL